MSSISSDLGEICANSDVGPPLIFVKIRWAVIGYISRHQSAGLAPIRRSLDYRPQRSCGQGNIFTGVCLSTGGGGGLPQCMLGCHTPPDGEPPLGWRTPPGWRTPAPRNRLQHTVYERPVRILLECILVNFATKKKEMASPELHIKSPVAT